MTETCPIRIACFVSSHGLGHAARICAVMEALHTAAPGTVFDVFTRVPRWFFDGSLTGGFAYHSLLTDVGVVQLNALTEDLGRTADHLDAFYPLDPGLVAALARDLRRRRCRIALCDIAPLGIAVARAAGIPSVLIENFTWDWIYAGYARIEPRMTRHVEYLRGLFESADRHIQTEPVCAPGPSDLVTPPFSRRVRASRAQTRQRFGIATDEPVVIVTMGGIQENHTFLDRLKRRRDVRFLLPGTGRQLLLEDNLILIPYHPDYHHPDLVHAADAVVGKVGYGTIAEVYGAGIPFGFVTRTASPESGVLADYVRRNMPGVAISEPEFRSGNWTAKLDELLAIPKIDRIPRDPAEEIARFILTLGN